MDEAPGRGDEAIGADVRRALLEDATTAHLQIEVGIYEGIVVLRGLVPDLADADAAKDVASRVPGVVQVHEDLRLSVL
jgi:osmotically-inducible protein OsmY